MHGSHPTNELTDTFICLCRFYTMTACSDPGIVYVKIPSDADNSTIQIYDRRDVNHIRRQQVYVVLQPPKQQFEVFSHTSIHSQHMKAS
jgi:hypothetical protein